MADIRLGDFFRKWLGSLILLGRRRFGCKSKILRIAKAEGGREAEMALRGSDLPVARFWGRGGTFYTSFLKKDS